MGASDGGFWPEEASVGEVVYPSGGRLGPRRQANLQLVMLHSGYMNIWIDGELHHAPMNTVCLLFPGYEERFAFAEECETHHSWVHLAVRHMPDGLSERLERLPWSLQLSPTMTQLMHEALLVRTMLFPTAREVLKALALQMFWRYIGEGEQRLPRAVMPASPIVERAQQFINTHLREPLTLTTIADAVAVSPPHLIRLFQAHLHTTPMNYLWQRRIARGIELLEQTGLTVGTIAEQCGFQSRYHFSRRIRQAVGYTPLEVRQRSWQRK